MAHPDVLIVGGGVSGLAAAYELARAGTAVTLLESRRLGAMASTWTLGGVRQSGRDPAELPLARAAVRRWQGLDAELDAPTGYSQRGNLRLARTVQEVEVIRRLVADQTAQGLDITFLPDNAAVRQLAPAISDRVLAASICPGDGHADPDMTVAALAGAAKRAGATLRESVAATGLITTGSRVIGVATTDGPIHADRVIVAAGVHAPELLAPLGCLLPLSVKLVCVLQTVAAPPQFEQVFGVANADAAGRQELSGRFRVTTGVGDWPGDTARWTAAGLQPALSDVSNLIARSCSALPVLAGLGIERVWGGLIDLTPDALPMLDAPEGFEGLVVGAGFSGHGFGIAPVTGQILKALTLGEPTDFDLTPFRSGRFGVQADRAPLTLHG